MSAKRLSGRSPLFGDYELEPQDEPPAGDCVGYVRLEGARDKLSVAIWRKGRWLDKHERPLAGKVELWYRMRPRGTLQV